MELHQDHRTQATPVDRQIFLPTSLHGLSPSPWAPGTPTSRPLSTQIIPRHPALLGTAMRGCGMSRGILGTGVELRPEKVGPGVVQVDLNKVLHLGTPLTSSHHGGTSLTSLHGARGILLFLHACRDLHISEDPSLPTSSHLLSTNRLHHPTTLDASLPASCRMTFLPGTTMTGHRILHTALSTHRENFKEICQVLLHITTPIRGFLPLVWGLNIPPGVEHSTQSLAHPHTASMVIRLICVIDSIQSKTTPVWYRMCPTLTFQLASWLH